MNYYTTYLLRKLIRLLLGHWPSYTVCAFTMFGNKSMFYNNATEFLLSSKQLAKNQKFSNLYCCS
jgi:hypothetical protein